MWRNIVLKLDPPPAGRASEVLFPAHDLMFAGAAESPSLSLQTLIERGRAEVCGAIADYCMTEFGPGELTGNIEDGFTFRPLA